MEKKIKSALWAMFATLLGFSLYASKVVDLRTALTEAGKSFTLSSSEMHASCGINYLFDGAVYGVEGSGVGRALFRGISQDADKHKITSQWFSIIPDSSFEQGKSMVLRNLTIYPLSYWGKASARVPTSMDLYGIDETGNEQLIASLDKLAYNNPNGSDNTPLGYNAKEGQNYTFTVPYKNDPAECGYAFNAFRGFKIVFTGSGAMKNSEDIAIGMMELALGVEIVESTIQRTPCNLASLMRESGMAFQTESDNSLSKSKNQYSNFYAGRLFDGITYLIGLNPDRRWLACMNKYGGAWGQLMTPDSFMSDYVFVPVALRMYALNNGANEKRRSPTEWKLFAHQDGSPADDAVWTEVMHTTDTSWKDKFQVGEWAGVQNMSPIYPIEPCSRGYRSFRFQPLNSLAKEAGEKNIDVGLNELEIYVNYVNKPGTLEVMFPRTGFYDNGFSHAQGTIVNAAANISAPEYAASDKGSLSRVTGYHVETYDYAAGKWAIGETVARRSFDYTPEPEKSQRLVWHIDCNASFGGIILRSDGGNEAPPVLSPAPLETINGAYIYELGTEITISASPNNDNLAAGNSGTNSFHSVFVRWDGNLGEGIDATQSTLRLTLTDGLSLMPVYRRDWLLYEYDTANEGGSGTEYRIKNGLFEFRVKLNDSAKKEMRIDDGTQGWYVSGKGGADFSTSIYGSNSGDKWKLVRINGASLAVDINNPTNIFTEIVLPRELRAVDATPFRDQIALAALTIDCPSLTNISGNAFTRDSALSKVVWKAPRLQRLANHYTFFKCPFHDTDASEWELDSLENIGVSAFDNGELASLAVSGFSGTLTLPSVETIGSNAFMQQRRVTNYVFGIANHKLATIGANAFAYNTALQSVTFAFTMGATVAADAFSAAGKLNTVVLPYEVPNQSSMDAILLNNTVSSRAVIKVSRFHIPGDWTFLTPVDKELDAGAPEGTVGIYVTADGERKGYIQYYKSPFDKPGMMIICR